jgi:hypothetical protein
MEVLGRLYNDRRRSVQRCRAHPDTSELRTGLEHEGSDDIAIETLLAEGWKVVPLHADQRNTCIRPDILQIRERSGRHQSGGFTHWQLDPKRCHRPRTSLVNCVQTMLTTYF